MSCEIEDKEQLLAQRNQMLVRTGDIITYSEYQNAIDGIYFEVEAALQSDISAPDWFHLYQKRALNVIRKKLAQSHLVPRNRNDYLDLKTNFWIEEGSGIVHTEAHNYQELFRDGLAAQIRFMHDEEVTFNNGWLNATNSLNIGGYSQSMTPDNVVKKIFNNLHPFSYDCFETMGWTYACLNHRLDWEDFYKGER